MERTTQIDWLSILKFCTPLTWDELIHPDMVGHCIWVVYPFYKKSEDTFTEEVLRIVGLAHVSGEWALVVKNWSDEDFIILEEGKGSLWEAYGIKQDI